MKIALLTMGTRGDVQPFAVLGKAMKQRGHEVTLATAKNFASLADFYGLNFSPVAADFQAILNSPEGKKMMSNPLSARKHFDKLIYPMVYDSLHTFYKVAKEHDKILFHVKAMAEYFVEHMPGKLIRANVVPAIEPTSEFVNPVFSALHLPSFLYRFSYKLSDFGLKMMSKPVNKFRQEVGITGKYIKPELPSIYGISPLFLPEPKDYPANSHFTGFWLDSSSTELSKELIDFIGDGEPPLLLTFGSMPFESKIDLSKILETIVKSHNTRVIVIKGWGLNNIEELTQNKKIKIIESAPYNRLLPLVKAVIHHGGIGTIASCLKAGKPFLTCPVLYPLGDQHFWGTIAYQKGVGLKPLPLKKMKEDVLLKSVDELLHNKSLYKRSEELKEKMKNENGVEKAIELIGHGF